MSYFLVLKYGVNLVLQCSQPTIPLQKNFFFFFSLFRRAEFVAQLMALYLKVLMCLCPYILLEVLFLIIMKDASTAHEKMRNLMSYAHNRSI